MRMLQTARERHEWRSYPGFPFMAFAREEIDGHPTGPEVAINGDATYRASGCRE
jgi:hypothetical protein